MANRLPTVGGDSGSWGTVLNAYLGTEHGSDGNHIERTLSTVATSGATQTLDLSLYGVFDITLSASCTLTFSNPLASGKLTSFILILRQDSTGGRTVTFPSGMIDHLAVDPSPSTLASSVSYWQFMTVNGGTTWLRSLVADQVA